MRKIVISVTALGFLIGSVSLYAQNRFEIKVPWEAASTFDLDVYPGKQISVTTERGKVRIDYGDGKGAVPISHVERDDAFNDKIGLRFDDFNFDGLMDIAIDDNGYGYMGVNINNSIYVYERRSGRFKKILGTTNVNLDRQNKLLISSSRSGPRWYQSVYKFNNGQPFIYKEKVSVGADLERVLIKNQAGEILQKLIVDTENQSGNTAPARRRITVLRAYLYSKPDNTLKTQAYLIEGDEVELLDSAGEWDDWFKIRFKGKKTLIRWIRAKTIAAQ